jgi:hypothetical protein
VLQCWEGASWYRGERKLAQEHSAYYCAIHIAFNSLIPFCGFLFLTKLPSNQMAKNKSKNQTTKVGFYDIHPFRCQMIFPSLVPFKELS